MVEMDLRPGARFPGRTHHVAAGLAGDNFITEGFTVVWAAGGLSEIRHDPEWCPEPHFRNDDLDEIRERLLNTGSSPAMIARYLSLCDEIATEFLSDSVVWRAVSAVASSVADRVGDLFAASILGEVISKAALDAASRTVLDASAEKIRERCAELHRLR